MTKTMRGAEVPGTPIQTFILHVDKGQFTDSEIVVMLGKWLQRVFVHSFDWSSQVRLLGYENEDVTCFLAVLR